MNCFVDRHSSTLYNLLQELATELASSASRHSCSIPVLLPHHSRKSLSNSIRQSHSFLSKDSLVPSGFRIKLSCFTKPQTSSSSLCEPLYTSHICSSRSMQCFSLLPCFCTCRTPPQGPPLHLSPQLMPCYPSRLSSSVISSDLSVNPNPQDSPGGPSLSLSTKLPLLVKGLRLTVEETVAQTAETLLTRMTTPAEAGSTDWELIALGPDSHTVM